MNINSKNDLKKVFVFLDNILRQEGLISGVERFYSTINILFLRLLNNEVWDSLKKQDNENLINYIRQDISKIILNKYSKDILLPFTIQNPQTLKCIIDYLDSLTFSNVDTDIKGDAFEFFLDTTTAHNDLGQFFTPREVVVAIIKLVDPKSDELIYDPFCGSGGILISALKHQNNLKLYGRDITNTAKVAVMNVLFSQGTFENIEQINSLTNPIDSKFDIVVSNIPFSMKLKDNSGNLYYNGLAKNNGDAACILHCLRALKQGGRMAIIVPEGFLFRKDIAKVREFLLSKAKLQSVISLPQGTFLPYTGVKTSILYFTNAHKQNEQKEYWFFEVKNIGVTLNNKKQKLEGINDLDKINEGNPEWEKIKISEVKNNDYNFVGHYYRKQKNIGFQSNPQERLEYYENMINLLRNQIENCNNLMMFYEKSKNLLLNDNNNGIYKKTNT